MSDNNLSKTSSGNAAADARALRAYEASVRKYSRKYGFDASPKKTDVNQWFDSAYKIIEEMNSYNDERWDVYDPNYGGETGARLSQILREASSVGDELRRQNPSDYSAWNNTLMEYRRVLSNLDQQNRKRQEYFGQFQDADAYSTALTQEGWRKKYDGQSVDQMRSAASALEDGDEKSWLTSYADQTEFNNNMSYDVAGGQKALQELQDKAQQMSILQKQILEYQSNPLLMLTNHEKYNQMLSDYQEFHNQGGMAALDEQMRQTQQATLAAKQTQDSVRQMQEHEQWLQTVRSPEAVSKELVQAKEKAQQLQEQISLGKDALRTPMGGINEAGIQTLQQDETAYRQTHEQIQALEKEYWWSQKQAYDKLQENKDFEEKSKYVSTQIPGASLNLISGNSGFRDV